MQKFFSFLFLFSFFYSSKAQKTAPKNLLVITIDGCRWQEVFRGADSSLLFSSSFTKDHADTIRRMYWRSEPAARRERLLPFLWSVVAGSGSVYGNRDLGNAASVKNPYNLSYPGYSEIFTGYADTAINSNALLLNPNTNVLEYLQQQQAYKGKVASVGSWDRFPYILNENRSGFPVNGGYEPAKGPGLSVLQQEINRLQEIAPKTVSLSSRPDDYTYCQAKEYLRLHHPRVMHIAFANTDDMAHAGNYGYYLEHIHAIDQYIASIWKMLQADAFYRNSTNLFITVDHGRGEGNEWTSHGAKVKHSNEIWFAATGPGVSGKGEGRAAGNVSYQNQFASTFAKMLGVRFTSSNPVGELLEDWQ